ncbi:hypothetical protein ASE37_21715 [Rhizobium sp. Root268]|nr:hypothetical protein ASC86_23145 [Rhizobium sp. Root1212]KRD35140.1 hypothetical protein ASE37_21715 [Rhizobium sp. Root268]
MFKHIRRASNATLRYWVFRQVGAVEEDIIGSVCKIRGKRPINGVNLTNRLSDLLRECAVAAADLNDNIWLFRENSLDLRDQPIVFEISGVLIMKLLVICRRKVLVGEARAQDGGCGETG